MTTTRPLTGPLLQSEARTKSRGSNFVHRFFTKYGTEKYAVMVDHTTVFNDIPELGDQQCSGYFTFDIHLAEKQTHGKTVNLLRADAQGPECDGWLIASTNRAAAFSLARALKRNGNEDQVICRLYGGQTTEMTAYMDLFSGDTETILYIHHYFNRKYRINHPIDLRYTACRCDGSIVHSGQRIIEPGGVAVFQSETMSLGTFEGFFRVDLEVENLQVRVQPFIHFWADYISDAGICRNHQSGWSPHPPGTVFNRGFLPTEDHLEAIASFYNDNDAAIRPEILMHCHKNGSEQVHERTVDPIPARQMRFVNLNELFSGINIEGVDAAYLLMTCDKPLHRPNHYISLKGTRQYIDTFHQTRGPACHLSKDPAGLTNRDREAFQRLGIWPWQVCLPLLDHKFGIDTLIGMLSVTFCHQNDFVFRFIDESGAEVFSKDERIDGSTPQFINLREYVESNNIRIDKGTFVLSPPDSASQVAVNPAVFFGLKHRSFGHIATSFREGKKEANLPFYAAGRFPSSREYAFSPLQVTEAFSPGFVSEEYDSLHIVMYQSLLRDEAFHVKQYQVEILDERGRMYCVRREVAAMSHDAFMLSEILRETGAKLENGCFSVWIKCDNAAMKSFHGLYRKADHALSFDDGSEGTLQVDPQIAGINPQKHLDKLSRFMLERGLLRHLPESWISSIKRIRYRKQLGR